MKMRILDKEMLRYFVQGHRADQRQIPVLILSSLVPESTLLTTTLCCPSHHAGLFHSVDSWVHTLIHLLSKHIPFHGHHFIKPSLSSAHVYGVAFFPFLLGFNCRNYPRLVSWPSAVISLHSLLWSSSCLSNTYHFHDTILLFSSPHSKCSIFWIQITFATLYFHFPFQIFCLKYNLQTQHRIC